MPDPKLLEKAMAAATSETAAPELRAKAQRWLAAQKVEVPVGEQPEVGGFDYAKYTVPKSGAETVGAELVEPDDKHPLERATERLAIGNDEAPELASASKRRSLYAEPIYQGKEGIGAFSNAPFTYFEPKVERIASELSSYRSSLPADRQKEVDAAIADLQKNGADSKTYKEAADRLWLETVAEFKRDGVPVQRVAHAPADGYRTGVNKVAGNYAAPFLYGADQAMTFGIGSALMPTFAQDLMSGTSPEQRKVLERLKQRGVLPSDADARGQEAEGHPWLQAAGGLTGLMMMGTQAMAGKALGLGTQAATKATAMAPAWLRGTTLASRLARLGAEGAVSGGVGSGLAGAGTQAVTEAFQGEHGGEASVGDVAERAGEDARFGALLGAGLAMGGEVIPQVLARVGKGAQERLRTNPNIGGDLRMVEQTGVAKPSVLWKLERTPEAEAMAKDALKPSKAGNITLGTSDEQSALQPVAKEALDKLYVRTAQENAAMQAAEGEMLKRLGNRQEKPYYLFNKLMETVRSRKNVPFAELSRYKEALGKISDVKPMLKTDPAARGAAQLTAQEVSEMGLDPEKLLQEGFAGKLAGRSRDNIIFTVNVRPMTAGQLDDATRGLAAQIKWGKDAGSKDRELRGMYDALVKTRKLFGDTWAETKANSERILSARDNDMTALGLQGKELGELGSKESEAAAYRALQGFGQKGSAPAQNEAVANTLRDSPEAAKRLQMHLGNQAYDRLMRPTGGGLSKTGLVSRALGSAQLRFDPVFGAMRATGNAAKKADTSELRKALMNIMAPGVEIPESLANITATGASTMSAAQRKRHE